MTTSGLRSGITVPSRLSKLPMARRDLLDEHRKEAWAGVLLGGWLVLRLTMN